MLSLTGFSDFARHYFRNLGWFLFLELLRCFSSPGSLRIPMYSVCDTPKGGFPHSEISGSKLICQLPEAYRRLSRPSSPIIAKASTICSYSLDSITLISLSRSHCLSRNVLFGLSPNALCRINLRLISYDSNPKIQAKRFLSKLKVVLTQSKKFVVNNHLRHGPH